MADARLRLLVWPALARLRRGGGRVRRRRACGRARLGRLATWGVRLGWLAQTALLVAQAPRADGFPWATWAGSLNLFVWLVRRRLPRSGAAARRYRLLGLVVMPLAVVAARARLGGGRRRATQAASEYSATSFLVFHVGLVLAAFAGFTLAAALAALYLWQERRLKRRAPGVLRLRAPSLVDARHADGADDRVALPALTVGDRRRPRPAPRRAAAASTRSWA